MRPPERDAPDQIDQWLWQGREPERTCSPYPVPSHISMLILCHAEHQEPWERFDGRGFVVVHAPFLDDTVTMRPGDELVAYRAALAAFGAMYHGDDVLITCHQGFNRSGLVSALALRLLHDWTGPAALQHVRENRPGAIYNPAFASYLEALR